MPSRECPLLSIGTPLAAAGASARWFSSSIPFLGKRVYQACGLLPSTPFFIPCVLKRSDTLTKCKKDPQLDLRAGLLQRFYSVCPPWPSRFCFIGWARVSGEREPLGGAFSTCC